MKLYATVPSPLGEMIALAEDDALTGLWFAGEKHAPDVTEAWGHEPDRPLFRALREQLAAYFNGTLQIFDLPLAPAGTPFRMAVWDLLRAIPYGFTTTYGTLAGQITTVRSGRRPAAQAVGGAVGHNPLTIIVPCHRVIGADGSLTGYAGGMDRKAALLALEKAAVRSAG